MIVSFLHKGLERFYLTGSKAGIQAEHAKKLASILYLLDAASEPEYLNAPTYRLHELQGDRQGIWSMKVNGNWRVTFRFVGTDIELVNYEDYH
jgi:Plasmid maintenance system killer protein